jgi:hypothetical protein
MSKMHRRGQLAISTIAAASALLVAAPAGASAAEEPGSGATSGETAAEPPGNSTQPAAPATTEWAPQGAEAGTSGGGSAPVVHGSSVGSGAVKGKSGTATSKAGSDGEAPSYTPDPGRSNEPQRPTPPSSGQPASPPRAPSRVHSEQPTTVRASKPVDVAAVGAATSLGGSAPPQSDSASPTPPATAAPFGGSSDRASTSSPALLLLATVALGLILLFAGLRFRRHRQRGRLEALWREQDAAWEAALRRAEQAQASRSSGPSAQPLQRIGVG